jgi:hypothetical protein
MSENKSIQLGLCCINTLLRAQKPPVYASRRMIVKSVLEKGIDVLTRFAFKMTLFYHSKII